ncbi:MAG: 2Fe-2S iron-sulfur cluster binding domain-containing protein [Desulfobulbaceae bacterium]|nr:2Fe-2S iron-sulfur cluster binding domain-containing protein [Desulfobulbaceae bacterium]
MQGKEFRIALKNVGRIDPASLADYAAVGGIAAIRRSLQMEPEKIIGKMTSSNLRGRGGAGFPAGLKERYTSQSPGSPSDLRYIICNADEGEPGTFKDRVIMENDPHLLIEGIIIAAYAIGASQGFIYIRGEYYLSIERVKKAIQSYYRKGYLGKHLLGSNFSLDLSVKLGAGSYLCGEELTLLESLEGKPGYPRIKPPFPAEHGLWGSPTLINNVETFAHIPYIIEKGVAHYLTLGTQDSPGTKFFTLSGDINRPGYCETEMGITLRELIEDFGQRMKDGKKFKAALGANLLQVARENGFDIPGLCYHKKLSPTGACRFCMVKVAGTKGFVMSCTVQVTEELEITAFDEELELARRRTLEYLLCEHNEERDGTYHDEFRELVLFAMVLMIRQSGVIQR